jgi:hypothetical protein
MADDPLLRWEWEGGAPAHLESADPEPRGPEAAEPEKRTSRASTRSGSPTDPPGRDPQMGSRPASDRVLAS